MLAVLVEQGIERHLHRLAGGSEKLHLIACEETVALSAVNSAVFTLFNYGYNVIIADISAVFVILRLLGNSEEEAL